MIRYDAIYLIVGCWGSNSRLGQRSLWLADARGRALFINWEHLYRQDASSDYIRYLRFFYYFFLLPFD
jgi:hypothetical protein